ncbi:MAG TPA: uracil phosphoribosyltransferase, partial [Phycisphaerae bacterium]|nr:uracil phosphoribosyltransferase [Phycisphaerae bacterium]
CKLARDLTLVPILRAGLGMAEHVHQLFPSARMGHIGIFRDENTLDPVVYYSKLPPRIWETDVIVIDPMIATAGSLVKAIEVIKQTGATSVQVLCLVAAPEGLERMLKHHPNVRIFTAAVDQGLNARGYIIPGLGDAGDRLYGTA